VIRDIIYVFTWRVILMNNSSIKRVRENVEDINALNQTKGKAIEAISQVDVVA
jgi:hypothetical protein